ncbi:MAG: hemolysin activation/secretion protein, partial [Verrucomicrobiales bacterium]
KSQIRTEKGEVLRSSELMGDLAWMNRSPYRRVDLVYAPGFEFGTTDLILRTNEIDPFTAYWGYENSGNDLLGEHRWVGGMTWAEAWGPDRTLSYQLTTDLEFDTISSHSMVYSMPLPWRQSLTLLGSYVDSAATVDIDGTPLDISGTSWQLSTRWAMPLKSIWENTSHELEIGTDFKSSNNNLEFGGAEFFDATTHIYQASIGYNLLAQGKKGATRIDLTGYISPGGIDDRNDDETFQQARADASSGYVYGTFGIEHSHRLPKEMTLRLRGQGQVSADNLLASEQLGIGGPSTVRGYDTSVARGDQGVLFSAELYSPTYSIADKFDWRGTTDELRFLAFVDYAAVSNANAAPGELDDQNLLSVGVGARWVYDDWLRFRLDVGFPIDETVADPDAVESVRYHIGVTTLW